MTLVVCCVQIISCSALDTSWQVFAILTSFHDRLTQITSKTCGQIIAWVTLNATGLVFTVKTARNIALTEIAFVVSWFQIVSIFTGQTNRWRITQSASCKRLLAFVALDWCSDCQIILVKAQIACRGITTDVTASVDLVADVTLVVSCVEEVADLTRCAVESSRWV
jgi:hypothetical protein